MAGHDMVVVGASAGGIEPLTDLVRGLPPEFPGSVFVVVHFPGSASSTLPQILSRSSALPVRHASQGDPIEPGQIYVGRPDCHLLIEHGRIRLTRGPKENGFRPAIDPLFRTAAKHYGPRVAGVILSGNLNDGTAGLLAIKQRGGIAIVQSLETALYPGMPRSAMEHMEVDHVLAPADMPALLTELALQPTTPLEVRSMTEEIEASEPADAADMNVAAAS